MLEQPGNRRLRRIVSMYAEQYVQTKRIDRGALKHQVYNLCRNQFEFVIQKQAFMRYYAKDSNNNNKPDSDVIIRNLLDELILQNATLQPENVLLDAAGHIQLTDFRLSKEGFWSSASGANSFCRTPEIAPFQPEWAAPMTPALVSAKRMGPQSAVETPMARPGVLVTSASAFLF